MNLQEDADVHAGGSESLSWVFWTQIRFFSSSFGRRVIVRLKIVIWVVFNKYHNSHSKESLVTNWSLTEEFRDLDLKSTFNLSKDLGGERKYVKIGAAGIWTVTHVSATHSQPPAVDHAPQNILFYPNFAPSIV